MTMQQLEHYSREFARIRGSLSEPVVREQALAALQQQGFPAPGSESWRDTNLGSVLASGFTAAQIPDDKVLAAAAARLQQLPDVMPGATRLVLVNGWYVAALSDAGALPQGLAMRPGNNLTLPDDSAFSLLGTVFTGTGVQLVVSGAKEVAVHLVHIYAGETAPLLACPRFVISLEQGATARILESHCATDGSDDGLSNCAVQLDMADGSRADYAAVQWDMAPRNQLQLLQARQQKDSRLQAVAASRGADCARRQTDVELCGPQASCELRGLYVLAAKRQMDFRTRVKHASRLSNSNQLVLGLVMDKARAMFHGHLIIDRDAQQVQAHQNNENLILAGSATAGSQPMLEIYADDVKCSHGASVGDIDHNALFYLRTRGFNRKEAEQMLAEAFVNRVVEAVSDEKLQACIRSSIGRVGS